VPVPTRKKNGADGTETHSNKTGLTTQYTQAPYSNDILIHFNLLFELIENFWGFPAIQKVSKYHNFLIAVWGLNVHTHLTHDDVAMKLNGQL
jgi:hypothetical protein